MSAKLTRCAWDGCTTTTETPYADGWAYLMDWGPGVPDGHYCRAHADALEAVLMEGGFEDPENDLKAAALAEAQAELENGI